MLRTGFTVLVVLGISVLWTQSGFAHAAEEIPATSTEPVSTTEYVDLSTQTVTPTAKTLQPLRTKRPLTPAEQEMADRARQHIAEVVKRNLIRLFTVIAATSGPGNARKRVAAAARQFGFGEDDDGDDEDLGFNPNTLPQVAQLLGAIFAGNLNLTSIVDRAFYLVPDTVRNQVQGVFSLLTGVTTTTARPVPVAAPAPAPAPAPQYIPVIPVTPVRISVPVTEPTTRATEQAADVVASFVISSPTRNKTKYKIRRKIPSTTHQPIVVGSEEYEIISDAELQRLEQNLVRSAQQYAQAAPTVPVAVAADVVPLQQTEEKQQAPAAPQPPQQQQQPMDFMGQLRQVFANTNMTQVIRAMPDLFNGARQAFTLLETLGQLDDIPILSDIFGGDDYDDDE